MMGLLKLANPASLTSKLDRISLFLTSLFVLGPALSCISLLPSLAGFSLFLLGGCGGLAVTLAGLIQAARGQTEAGLRAIVLGGLPGSIVLALAIAGMGFPPLNDVTTDLEHPPAFAQAEIPAYPPDFKPQVQAAYPALKPLNLPLKPANAFALALSLARLQPRWQITHIDEKGVSFEGTATSSLFRFQDDFIVTVQPQGQGALINMRSRSRVGRSDFGANAKRIREFFDGLNQNLTTNMGKRGIL